MLAKLGVPADAVDENVLALGMHDQAKEGATFLC